MRSAVLVRYLSMPSPRCRSGGRSVRIGGLSSTFERRYSPRVYFSQISPPSRWNCILDWPSGSKRHCRHVEDFTRKRFWYHRDRCFGGRFTSQYLGHKWSNHWEGWRASQNNFLALKWTAMDRWTTWNGCTTYLRGEQFRWLRWYGSCLTL